MSLASNLQMSSPNTLAEELRRLVAQGLDRYGDDPQLIAVDTALRAASSPGWSLPQKPVSRMSMPTVESLQKLFSAVRK